MHGRSGHRDLGDGGNRDADCDGVHNAHARSDARNCHADCCSESESNRDRHGDIGSEPGSDRHGDSEPEHGADCYSDSYAESNADAGAHADENTHVSAHKGADALSDSQTAMIGAGGSLQQ